MKHIKNETKDIERAYFGSKNTRFDNVTIAGELDGESAFKECKNIEINKSKLQLRYPCWHDTKLSVRHTSILETARAPFWYDKKLFLENVNCHAPKAIRECSDVTILNSGLVSQEFGWKCRNMVMKNSFLEGEYAFFDSKNVKITNLSFKGKYSFQYMKNLNISGSVLNTKDAFWHSENCIIKNCEINGEYIGWYAKNLTFINCKIRGTQPFCYAKKLKFIDCEFFDCDLAFEYSEVTGNIKGQIISIKNPRKGKLVLDSLPELIFDKEEDKKKFRITVK